MAGATKMSTMAMSENALVMLAWRLLMRMTEKR